MCNIQLYMIDNLYPFLTMTASGILEPEKWVCWQEAIQVKLYQSWTASEEKLIHSWKEDRWKQWKKLMPVDLINISINSTLTWTSEYQKVLANYISWFDQRIVKINSKYEVTISKVTRLVTTLFTSMCLTPSRISIYYSFSFLKS